MSLRSIVLAMPFLLIACGGPETGDTPEERVDHAYREIAIQHCSSCHGFPEPELLDLQTWNTYVLPRMGHFMGMYADDEEIATLIEEGSGGEAVLKANVFPEEPIIDSLSWHRIKQYYLHHAPSELEAQNRAELLEQELFEVKTPGISLSPPSSTLVKFTDQGEVLLGDAHTEALYFLDKNFELQNLAKVNQGAVDVFETEEYWWLTVMGSFSPTDARSGMLVKLPKDREGAAEIVVSDLQRPVDALFEDFNQDGLTDIVISEFGKWTGSLSLHINKGDGLYERSIIEARPGATKAESRDINGDGLPDIIALFGQGIEALEAYINKGDGSFKAERLLEFESSYGSSSFTLMDLNDDGLEDLIYTAGDNADYLPILKPFHGVYLFFNEGNYQFSQEEFLPQNGAFKAIPADFDGDGDIDIASISFFPDYISQPNEGFVYFENTGEGYTPKSFDNLKLGRWISMDISDYDQDGDPDLILGSLAFETVPVQQELESMWINQGIPFLILENKSL